MVLHEAAEGGGVFVGEVGELDAEARVAEVVEHAAAHLPPLVLGERDADVNRLAEERLDGGRLKQEAAAAQRDDLAVVLVPVRQPPLDGE